jgi:dephospho-CoA kinase
MLKVGLTGGIASGKSVVAEMFAALGAHVTQADQIAHQLMQPGEKVYEDVVRHFGLGILNPDQTVNRALLAEAAFGATANGPSRVQELNHIVHPAVLIRQEQWMDDIGRKDPKAVTIVEAALILEAGAAKQFDRLIVVSCHPEQRVQRWSQRLHLSEDAARAEVSRRMAAQWPDAEKIKAADYVIDNSGSLDDTRAQVEILFPELKGLGLQNLTGTKIKRQTEDEGIDKV